jgi:hypothetical protein
MARPAGLCAVRGPGREMQSLFRLYYDIALWRRGPRDVPASIPLLAFVALLNFVVSVVQARFAYPDEGLEGSLLRAAADLALSVVFFWIVLALGRRAHRYVQTLSALLGTGTLLALPMLALLLVGLQVPKGSPLGFLVSFAALPLLIWALFVVGHVVRSALEAPLLTGMAVATTYFVVGYVLLVQLFPGSGA